MDVSIVSWLSILYRSDIALYGLEYEREEVSRYFIISESELDSLVYMARLYEYFIEAGNIIGSYNQDPAFL
jgi:hypothetical protein